MNDLKTLLGTANVRRAVIIDDAYEEAPIAKDLSVDQENWTRFFEDLNNADIELIKALFPLYDRFRGDELRSSDEFVAVLWKQQGKLRNEIIAPLFDRYKDDKAKDLAYLEALKNSLETYGIACEPAGRDFAKKAEDADLIVIDLFLDSAQDQKAMQNSVDGLKEVIRKRSASPPLVVLMSRSSRLEEKRKEFRDNSGLFESAFRIIRKTDLAEEGKLPRLLARLAEHYRDSRKLAAFLFAWQTGLNNARDRTADLIRTLDLGDIAQIQQLLLTEEGELPGSYLVDVFDTVLQHEIEREKPIIDAALDLNELNSDTYPPPYVAGSPDLQALVWRSLFHNNGRLRLRNQNITVLFGDVLCRKPAVAAAAPPAKVEHVAPTPTSATSSPPGSPAEIAILPAATETSHKPTIESARAESRDVFIVMTPACDLQRRAAKQVLLLKGTLMPLTLAAWSYKETPVRTMIFETSSKERVQIKWDLKHIETIPQDDLKKLLLAADGFEVIGRLREPPALELQQKLLSSLGRIGIIAPMPATFPVNIEAYLPGPDRKLFKMSVPALSQNQAVCFVGRKDNEQARTLVLCEDACEALCEAINSIDLKSVHPSTHEAILSSRVSGDLLVLQKGIDFAAISDQKFSEIVSFVAASAEKPSEKRVIGLIRRNGSWLEEPVNGGLLNKAGVVLAVSDQT